MKRFFICAAAAIVALASCSKTEVINNEPQKEIGFKAITSVATKAEQTTANLGTMGVYAYLNEGKSAYFGNTQFAKGAGDLWVATPSKYWPLVHTLDFVVYAPYAAEGTSCDSATKTLTVNTTNAGLTEITDQTDFLYGKEYYDNTDDKGYGKGNAYVPVDLKHAQAKIIVKFIGTPNVTLNEAKLTSVSLSGRYTVDYKEATPVAVWTAQSLGVDVTMASGYGLAEPKTYTLLAVPSPEASEITFDYTLTGGAKLNHTIDLTAWEPGKEYTYTITITPMEIKFKPNVIEWEPETITYPTL